MIFCHTHHKLILGSKIVKFYLVYDDIVDFINETWNSRNI